MPEDLATQSVRLKEEQLRREEEKLREIELKVQREISEKRQELLAKEESLRYAYAAAMSPLFSLMRFSGTSRAVLRHKALSWSSRRPRNSKNLLSLSSLSRSQDLYLFALCFQSDSATSSHFGRRPQSLRYAFLPFVHRAALHRLALSPQLPMMILRIYTSLPAVAAMVNVSMRPLPFKFASV